MVPGRIQRHTMQRLALEALFHQVMQRKRSVRRVLEQALGYQGHTTIDHRRAVIAGDEPLRIKAKIVAAGKAGGAARMHAEQHHFGRVVEFLDHPLQRLVAPLGPEGIGVHDEERIGMQHGQGQLDAAAGAQERVLATDLDQPAEVGNELVGAVMGIGDEAFCPLVAGILHHPLDERHAGHWHQRFGDRLGQRPQPHAQARRQQHHIRESAGVAHARI